MKVNLYTAEAPRNPDPQAAYIPVNCDACGTLILTYCHAVRERKALRAIRAVVGEKLRVACLQCARGAKMLTDAGATDALSRISTAIRKAKLGEWGGMGEALVAAQGGLLKCDRELAEYMQKIRDATVRANCLKRQICEAETAFGVYLLSTYEQRRKTANRVISRLELRLMVFARDGNKCVLCAAPNRLTVDHKVPVAKGGTDDLENLQTLCKSCNSSKGDDYEDQPLQ